jgi:hypothetical protein
LNGIDSDSACPLVIFSSSVSAMGLAGPMLFGEVGSDGPDTVLLIEPAPSAPEPPGFLRETM